MKGKTNNKTKQPKKQAAKTPPAKKGKKVTKATKKPSVQNTSGTKRVPNGRTVKTQDKFLPVEKKGKSTDPKDRRTVVVIDSNSAAELAVVRLTTQKQANTSELPSYIKGNKKKTRFKHFVEITDNEGKPIKIDGIKFIENGKEYDLTVAELQQIRNKVLKHSAQATENKKKLAKLKKRIKKR